MLPLFLGVPVFAEILCSVVIAAEPPALDEALAANRARQEAAGEESRWRAEQERLQALVAAAQAEAARAQDEAAQARRQVTETRQDLGTPAQVEAVRARLDAVAVRQRQALTDLAKTLPPGAVVVPAESTSEAVAAAVAATERAAGQVTVEVVSGVLGGSPRAAKVLRVAGARAWWLALDGRAGGIVRVHDGVVEFLPLADPRPIAEALAAVEGRGPVRLALLPEAP